MSEQISDEFGSLSLNNGKNKCSTEVKKTWHWSPIEGLHYGSSIGMKHHFIRQEIARMNIYPEAGVGPALRRKKGIVIGVARAASAEIYGIDNKHLTYEGKDTPKLVLAEDGHTIEIKNDVDSKWKEELSKPLILSETENKVIAKLFYIALLVIPIKYYLVDKDNSFYNTLLNTAILGVEKYFFTGFDKFSWWKVNEEDLRDAMWNKALEPVSFYFKMNIASSDIYQFLKRGVPRAAIADEVSMERVYRDLLKYLVTDEDKWKVLNEMLSYLENFSNHGLMRNVMWEQ